MSTDIALDIIMTIQAVTTVDIVNESFYVWGPDFVMFLFFRVLPESIRL